MKFKRILICLFAFFMVFSFAACKNNNNNGNQGNGQGTTQEVSITFESNGGSEVAQIKAEAGAAITKPADPTKENLTFGGWYSDVDLTVPYEFPATMPNQNVELFAKWVSTLTFDSQGGPSYDPIVLEGGKTFKMPADPVREGYVFVGWYTDKAYTNKLTYVMPRSNTTAYAKWQVFETGSLINVPVNFTSNDDGAYVISEENGTKLTAAAGKGEWSYCAVAIPIASKNNQTVVIELQGTKDVNVTLKIEGGNAEAAIETTVAMTGEAQTVIFTGEEKNFSSILGARVLVFLNGGTVGCGETPEYVTIKSVKLCRTVDAEATQKAAIFFNVNGGDPIAEYYDVPGTAVSAPEDPERAGWVFAGWYADKDLTTPFEFTTIPASGAVAYAKWEKAKELKEDIIILGGELVLAEDTKASAQYNEQTHALVVSKGEGAGAYEWIGIKFAEGADPAGYDHLRVTFKGPKGQKMLFKIYDSNTIEKRVECTGEMQALDIEFDGAWQEGKFAITLMPNADVEGASGNFEIYALQLGNYPALHDALANTENWSTPVNEAGEPDTKTTFSIENGVLKFAKAEFEGEDYNWDCVKYMAPVDLNGFNGLSITLKGTAGEEVMIKVYDTGGSMEHKETMTGELQQFFYEFEADYNSSKAALVLFANPGANGTGHEIEVSSVLFVQTYTAPSGEEPVAKEDVDLLANPKVTANGHQYHWQVVMAKNGGGQWDWAGLKTDADLTGYTTMVAEVTGPNGAQFKFKVNDQVEVAAHGTGELVHVEWTAPENFAWNADAQTMIMFPDFGAPGVGSEFVVTKLELQGEGKDPIDLLAATLSTGNPVCTAHKELVVSKPTTNTEAWDSFWLEVSESVAGYKGVKYTIKGTAGEVIKFKSGDEFENDVTFTGEVQSGVIDLSDKDIKPEKKAMVLFVNPNATGTGHEVIISELVFIYDTENGGQSQPAQKEDIDLLANPKVTANGHQYHWQVVMAKNGGGQWDWAGLKTDADLTGYTTMVAEVTGPNGAQFKFKVNDQVEVAAHGTGELVHVEWTTPENFVWNAGAQTMIMFPDFGAAGAGNEFIVTKLELQGEGKETINLLAGTLTTANAFCTAHKELVVVKPTTNTEAWDSFWLEVSESVAGYKGVKYTIKGTAGEVIKFKSGDEFEHDVTFTGEVQSGVIDLSDKDLKPEKKAMVLFVNPNATGTGHEVVISELVFLAELPE